MKYFLNNKILNVNQNNEFLFLNENGRKYAIVLGEKNNKGTYGSIK